MMFYGNSESRKSRTIRAENNRAECAQLWVVFFVWFCIWLTDMIKSKK